MSEVMEISEMLRHAWALRQQERDLTSNEKMIVALASRVEQAESILRDWFEGCEDNPDLAIWCVPYAQRARSLLGLKLRKPA